MNGIIFYEEFAVYTMSKLTLFLIGLFLNIVALGAILKRSVKTTGVNDSDSDLESLLHVQQPMDWNQLGDDF